MSLRTLGATDLGGAGEDQSVHVVRGVLARRRRTGAMPAALILSQSAVNSAHVFGAVQLLSLNSLPEYQRPKTVDDVVQRRTACR